MLPLLAEIAPKSSREAENETKRTGGEEPILGEDKVASAAKLGQEKMGHLSPDTQQAPKMDLLAQSTQDDEAQASTGDQPTLVQQADCEEQHQATVQTQPIHGGEGEPAAADHPAGAARAGAAKTKWCGRKVVQMPSRRSGRKARFLSVPVSKRAEVRLMEEMGLLTPGEPVGDAAVEAYAKSFDTPLPSHVIAGLRVLTRLDGVHDMPVPGEEGTTATAVPLLAVWSMRLALPCSNGLKPELLSRLMRIALPVDTGLQLVSSRVDRLEDILEAAELARAGILCLQETKLSSIDQWIGKEIGGNRLSNFNFLPANGTRGGIAIFWDDTIVNMANFSQGTHHLSAMAMTITDNLSFIITVVYGPSEDCDKENFLAELVAAKPPTDTPWLVMGDFNIIYEARDKNNQNLNRRLMGRFSTIHILLRPLPVAASTNARTKEETEAWNEPIQEGHPTWRLSQKLRNTEAALRKWSKQKFGQSKLQFAMVQELIYRLDVALETRTLTAEEHQFRKDLKIRILGLAAVEKARKKQASRVKWLKEGDANTRFFYIKMNARRRKNSFIACSKMEIPCTHMRTKQLTFMPTSTQS
uniref:Endonuclease/exonuclease/phosphatase domain-containing protein n=1 Tax=Oryza sativa subsp. japonica TaxID=39947 RepID=Q75J84_ORYSJ|nr:hypothetical protein [Oryza sativa Japonica Group]